MNPTPRKVQNSTYTSRRLDSHSQSSQSYLSEYDHLNQNEDSSQQNHLLHKKSLQLQPIPRKAHSCSLPVWSFVQPALFLLPSLSLLLRSEEHTSELQSRFELVCRLLLEKQTPRPRAQTP